MKKIKVLIVAGSMDVGGIENQLMYLLRNINRDKFQIDFTSTMKNAFYRQEIENLGGQFILIPHSTNIIRYCKALYYIMKNGKYDIVHSNELFHSGIVMFLAYKAGVKCRFVHAHNWSDADGISDGNSLIRNVYNSLMQKMIIKYSTDQIACSTLAGKFLYGRHAINKESYHLVYNSVDTTKFLKVYGQKESGEFCDDGWINILQVGRITAVKNQIFLVKIAAEFRRRGTKIRILCAGNGDEEYVKKIRQVVNQYHLSKYIKLLGVRTDIDILMRKASAFVLPSKYEGMPLVLIEAQASGLPCVVADTFSHEVDFGLNRIDWLKLDDGVVKWADHLEKAVTVPKAVKSDVQKAIGKYGFDSEHFANTIFDLYEKAYRREKKIKILFLIPNFSNGGAERVLQNLVNNLNQNKFDITVQTIEKINNPRKYLRPGIHYKYINPYSEGIRNKLFNYWLRFCAEYKLAYSFYVKDKYDIEIAYLETGVTKIIAGSTNRRALKLAWIHCDLQKKEGIIENLQKSRKYYNAYDYVVCVSDDVRKKYVQLFGNKIPSIVIYNVIDDQKILQESESFIPDIKNESGVVQLVAVGRLTQEKSFDRLIEACHRIKQKTEYDFHLNILGEGPMKASLEGLIKKYKLEDNIKLMGFQKNPYPYIKNADLLVCSSIYEGFSTVVVEAMILGTPVLTTECAGMTELLGNSKYGLITENSINGLYKGLVKLLGSNGELKRYTRLASERGQSLTKKNTVRNTEHFLIRQLNKKYNRVKEKR